MRRRRVQPLAILVTPQLTLSSRAPHSADERLKGTFIAHILAGKGGIPSGVVGLDGAIEALRLADMLAPALKQCWTAKADTWQPPVAEA